jgi:hypothetical protein
MFIRHLDVITLGETQMSEQEQDQNQLEQQLEDIFNHLLDGAPLDNEQIDLLRYGCGLPKINYNKKFLSDIFSDMDKAFTRFDNATQFGERK